MVAQKYNRIRTRSAQKPTRLSEDLSRFFLLPTIRDPLLQEADCKNNPAEPLPYARELAEFIGTFMLVFAGSGAAIVNQLSEGAITHAGASFVAGGVLAALIYTFAHISGAHVNPAVTLAFWSSGFCRSGQVLPYIVAQIMGGTLASMLLLFSFGPVANLGATLPVDDHWQRALVLETVLTFIMMLVVFGSGLDRRSHVGFGGLAIGLTVALEVMVMGPVTGGSMNPARSFAPALVSGIWQHQWLYWVAPILGGQLAVVVYRYLSNNFRDAKAEKIPALPQPSVQVKHNSIKPVCEERAETPSSDGAVIGAVVNGADRASFQRDRSPTNFPFVTFSTKLLKPNADSDRSSQSHRRYDLTYLPLYDWTRDNKFLQD